MKKSQNLYKAVFLILVTTVFSFNLKAQADKKLSLGDLPVFKTSKTAQKIKIDGKLNENDWQKTEARSFDYFYNVVKPDDQQKSTFRMLWDDENIYVFFECQDKYITAREKVRDGQPYFDDCAELFLIPVADSLKVHFGFELNLYKVANDFVFLNSMNHGENVVVKAYNPEYEVAVSIDGTVNNNSDIDKGWTMEMKIPFKSMNSVGFPFNGVGSKWAFLALRQDRNDAEGDRRSTSTITPVYEDEVHAPNRFCLLEFVK